jgi:hypothetical protein
MGATRVVARYTDGRVIKGFTQDFFANKDRFHLILDDNRRTVVYRRTISCPNPSCGTQAAERIVDELVRWPKERIEELDLHAFEFELLCQNQ